MTVIGVDPGSRSWSIVVLDDELSFHEIRIPSKHVKERPKTIYEYIETYKNVQTVVIPSGYGLPLKQLSTLTEQDLALLTLKHPGENRVLGLTEVLTNLKAAEIPGFVLPGVIHLSTVPKHRKLNRIDMGTPDKVCSVAVALKTLSDQWNLTYDECNFILVEAGSAFTAVIGIQSGMIVDGIGGAEGCMGFRARGGMDGELCYLLKNFQKHSLYHGGFLDIIGALIEPTQVNQEFVDDRKHRKGWRGLVEETAKDIISVSLSCTPDYVVLSGSLATNPVFHTTLQKMTGKSLSLQFISLSQFYTVKETALGAAYIADGIIGGENAPLVDILELRRAFGTCLDYISMKEELKINIQSEASI
ncbi:MAG: DUF1464 family protein [Candidatus Heimdallarchaeota archaeon]